MMKPFVFGGVLLLAACCAFAPLIQGSDLDLERRRGGGNTSQQPPGSPSKRRKNCQVKFDPLITYSGTCVYPDSADQCMDGMTVRADCGHNGVLCCVKLKCNDGLNGECQNTNKNCPWPGEWTLGPMNFWGDGFGPIKNPCPFLGSQSECCVRHPDQEKTTTSSSSGLRIFSSGVLCPAVDGSYPSCTDAPSNPCCVDPGKQVESDLPGDSSIAQTAQQQSYLFSDPSPVISQPAADDAAGGHGWSTDSLAMADLNPVAAPQGDLLLSTGAGGIDSADGGVHPPAAAAYTFGGGWR